MVIGKGGAGVLTEAMVGTLRAKGGTIQCNAPVARIVHRGRTAHGVVLADGREVTATRAVIANTAPAGLLKLTGDSGRPRFDAAMRAFDHAPGTMMIHLAMADLPDWAAGADLRRFAYVHVAPSLDHPTGRRACLASSQVVTAASSLATGSTSTVLPDPQASLMSIHGLPSP